MSDEEKTVTTKELDSAISSSLSSSKEEVCPSLEDIAELIDGEKSEDDKNRLMQHISNCLTCYEVFTMSSSIVNKKEKKPMLRVFSVAASLIVGVISIYLIINVDKSKLDPFADEKMPSPSLTFSKSIKAERKIPVTPPAEADLLENNISKPVADKEKKKGKGKGIEKKHNRKRDSSENKPAKMLKKQEQAKDTYDDKILQEEEAAKPVVQSVKKPRQTPKEISSEKRLLKKEKMRDEVLKEKPQISKPGKNKSIVETTEQEVRIGGVQPMRVDSSKMGLQSVSLETEFTKKLEFIIKVPLKKGSKPNSFSVTLNLQTFLKKAKPGSAFYYYLLLLKEGWFYNNCFYFDQKFIPQWRNKSIEQEQKTKLIRSLIADWEFVINRLSGINKKVAIETLGQLQRRIE